MPLGDTVAYDIESVSRSNVPVVVEDSLPPHESFVTDPVKDTILEDSLPPHVSFDTDPVEDKILGKQEL